MPSSDRELILPLLRRSIPGTPVWDCFTANDRPIFEFLTSDLFVCYVFDDSSMFRFISGDCYFEYDADTS